MGHDSNQTPASQETLRALEANRSPRFKDLHALELWVETKQYVQRKSFWDTDCGDALWERAPLIAYPVVSQAIGSNVELLLGEGRFPSFEALDLSDTAPESDETDEAARKEAQRLSDFVEDLHRISRYKTAMRQGVAHAQGARSVAVIVGIVGGKPNISITKSKWSTPKFDSGGAVTELEIRYPYLDRVFDRTEKKWVIKAKLFRRVIDNKADTTYKPADADKNGEEPIWVADPAQTFEHGFGFCPVVWYAHKKGVDTVNQFDGVAIHQNALDEIEAHDFAISQRHRAAITLGEPQWCEFGVSPGHNPTEGVQHAISVPSARGPSFDTEENPGRETSAFVGGPGVAPTRKKGPGFVYQYPNENSKVELVGLPPGSLEPIDNHARDLRSKISEALGVVFIEAEGIKFQSALSGKALALLKARQLDKVDELREDAGENLLVPVTLMLVRVVASQSTAVKVRNASMASEIVAQVESNQVRLDLSWGEYFKPGIEEQKQTVEMVQMALGAGGKPQVVTLKTGLEKLDDIFQYGDIGKAMEAIEAAQEEAAEKAQEQAMKTAEIQAKAKPVQVAGQPPNPKAPPVAKKPPIAKAS